MINFKQYYSWEKLDAFTQRHFNGIFFSSVFLILGICYLVTEKTAALNLSYILIIVTGYYKRLLETLLYTGACIILIAAFLFTLSFFGAVHQLGLHYYLYIYFWGLTLLLTGTTVSKLQEKLRTEAELTNQLNTQLSISAMTLNTLKEKLEETLYRAMDETVAKLMVEGRLRNEKHQISILFSDLVGYSNYAGERSPESIVFELNNYIMLMENVILKYRGHIDKYLGDGIMCEFGAPLNYDCSRLLSVVAAYKMQEALKNHDFPWKMRIGIAYGFAVTGLIGGKRQSYTSIGDVVNMASHIEKMCPPGSTLVNEAVHDEIKRFFETRIYQNNGGREQSGVLEQEALDELCAQLNNGQENADNYLKIGRILLSLNRASEAVGYFCEGISKFPDSSELKVAFAESSLKTEEREKLHVKGKQQGVMIYEVLDFKDIRLDQNKFTQSLLSKYPQVDHLIKVPEDIILPIEAISGCIRHSLGVAHFAFAVARELSLPEEETSRIIQAAYLADIGKEVIPHHVLNVAGSLNENETSEIRKHPEAGEKILRSMGYDDPLVLRCILHSHEYCNGSGYPAGLPGNEIPLGARIIAVCDTYNALTSWRPYRDAWTRQSALAEIKFGVQKGIFDPDVVDALIKALT